MISITIICEPWGEISNESQYVDRVPDETLDEYINKIIQNMYPFVCIRRDVDVIRELYQRNIYPIYVVVNTLDIAFISEVTPLVSDDIILISKDKVKELTH